ncbi:right-handed parallel beta-helix repeat-containing protein [Methylicorpusculum oleiharenae]|uniref:right-handed parallel beta-helix repeat-containing protein n=1 Tax=Methylicorpusculum oleiharenae TaxID=1338687 RepID=UPI001356927E|nr:right-handed parallel beta-helix repeat-containing protein [Methylicorpusculum oleiharenae]MCD2448864.1 right-handed parallel beta-helix repeat-containing protein [Methylicorpusculum oleiharenae]
MKSWIKVLLSITVLFGSNAAQALELYVSPNGRDQWSGALDQANREETDGPFQTLYRAQQEIRKLKAKRVLQGQTTVNIAGGIYYLDKPLSFDLRDSGLNEAVTRWQGKEGEKITLSGGKPLTDCLPEQASVWSCSVRGLNLGPSKLKETGRIKGSLPGFELFVDGQRMRLARWPNEGWAHIKVPLDAKTQFTTFETIPLDENGLSQAHVHIWPGNDWFDEYLPVKTIDFGTNKITVGSETAYPLKSGHRFYLLNVQSQLDVPGEWFYDRDKERIQFIPPFGQAPQKISVSVQKNLMTVDGAKNLNFSNLSFEEAVHSAVVITKSDNVILEKLEIKNAGAKAIEINGGQNISVKDGYFHHLGRGGILAIGGERKTLYPGLHSIINNHFSHFAEIVKNLAAAIDVQGVGQIITHNLIENGPSMGILINGNEHLIEKNELHHLCEEASDCGAIYSGRDWTYRGNIIRYNSLHDIYGYGLKAVDIAKNTVEYVKSKDVIGVYLDDAVSGFTIYGNLFNHAGTKAIQLGGGRDNTIENNVFITDVYAIWVDNRWPDYKWSENQKNLKAMPYQSSLWRAKYPELQRSMNNEKWPEGNRIQRNIIITTKPDGRSLRYFLPYDNNIISDNLVWSTNGVFRVDYHLLDKQEKKTGMLWLQWLEEGMERNSINQDPCLTLTNNTVKFCDKSPVKRIGFTSLPADIGLIK